MVIASDIYDTDAIYSGYVDFQGGIDVLPAGWTITRPFLGVYKIFPDFVQTTNTGGIFTDLRVIVSVVAKVSFSTGGIHIQNNSATFFTVKTEKSKNGAQVDQSFFFIAIKVDAV